MKFTHRHRAHRTPASWPTVLLTQHGGHAGACAALQAMLFTLLTWAALLCTGLGGTVGTVSQALAGKLASGVQHLQRHGGTSLSSRAVRREIAAVVAEVKAAESQSAVAEMHAGGAVQAGGITLPAGQPHSDTWGPAAASPSLGTRYRSPQGRAPPDLG